jgi:hypothetical protein
LLRPVKLGNMQLFDAYRKKLKMPLSPRFIGRCVAKLMSI